jgi:thiol-disulfide isomerase/thioredoxin
MRNSQFSKLFLATTLVLLTCMPSFVQASICPFCSAINLTFAEQMRKNDVVVIAKVINIPPPVEDIDAELPRAQFEIVQVLKGNEFVEIGMKFKTLLVGKYDLQQEFLVMGADPPAVVWTTPMKASDRVVSYIEQVTELPEEGAERLEFFQQYFEDKESILAFDAYDEFAQAPYKDLIALKDQMPREKLMAWITDPETSVNRRRLYFTMLGVCGTEEDIEVLEELIQSGDRKKQAGLDALIACYLNLKKTEGVDLIEEQFITNTECDYVDTLAAVSALRFHGTEVDFIPKDRIVSAVRHLLDRPKMADMIIPDLARWEDWTVVDKLVQMFKDADEETNWLRVPVVNYLRACPDPDAKKHIEELRKIDPDAVRRAEFFADFDDADFDDEDEDDSETTEGTPADAGDKESGKKAETSNAGGLVGSPAIVTSPAYRVSTSAIQENVKVRKVPLDSELNRNAKTVLPTDQPEKLEQVDEGTEVTVAPISSEITTPANSELVNTVSNTTAAPALPQESAEVSQQPEVETIAQSSTLYTNPTWLFIFVPMLFSGFIFVLLWSVINGWFQRLIF